MKIWRIATKRLRNSIETITTTQVPKVLHTDSHHWWLVITMQDIDEVSNSQHTCGRNWFTPPFLDKPTKNTSLEEETHALPTNLCNLLSHRGAALKPFATRAKNALFTFRHNSMTVNNKLRFDYGGIWKHGGMHCVVITDSWSDLLYTFNYFH